MIETDCPRADREAIRFRVFRVFRGSVVQRPETGDRPAR